MTLMSDPIFPKGNRYAADVLRRNPALQARTQQSISSFMKRQMKNQYLSILGAMRLNPDLLNEDMRSALARVTTTVPRNAPGRTYKPQEMALRQAGADARNALHLHRGRPS